VYVVRQFNITIQLLNVFLLQYNERCAFWY